MPQSSKYLKEVRRALQKSGEEPFRHREHTASAKVLQVEIGPVCPSHNEEASKLCGTNDEKRRKKMQ